MAIKLQKIAKIQWGILLAAVVLAVVMHHGKAQAACSVDTSRGTVTSTLTVPADGSYTFWARMQATSANNDSIYISIDGSDCNVIGDTDVPVGSWKWVNYQNGQTSNIAKGVQLTAGTHTIQVIGREDGVKLDRMLLLTDGGCTPTDTGDNCVTSNDTQAPTNVAITSPTNNATLQGSSNIIQASALDNVGVTRVDFYIGNTLFDSDSTGPAPYTGLLDATKYTSGSYQLKAVAYDAAGWSTTSSVVNVTINNPPPDNQGPDLSITSPLNGATMSTGDALNVTATATDLSGVKTVEFQVDGTTKSTQQTSSSSSYKYSGSTLSAGQHTITVKATDASSAANVSTASVTITVNTATPARQCDFDGDGAVTYIDLSTLLSHYKKTVTANKDGDCNGDGTVTISDLSMLLSNYGK